MPKNKIKNVQSVKDVGICRDCSLVSPITRFQTLSLKGEPTLGECPFQTAKVLLSQRCDHPEQKEKSEK